MPALGAKLAQQSPRRPATPPAATLAHRRLPALTSSCARADDGPASAAAQSTHRKRRGGPRERVVGSSPPRTSEVLSPARLTVPVTFPEFVYVPRRPSAALLPLGLQDGEVVRQLHVQKGLPSCVQIQHQEGEGRDPERAAVGWDPGTGVASAGPEASPRPPSRLTQPAEWSPESSPGGQGGG